MLYLDNFKEYKPEVLFSKLSAEFLVGSILHVFSDGQVFLHVHVVVPLEHDQEHPLQMNKEQTDTTSPEHIKINTFGIIS